MDDAQRARQERELREDLAAFAPTFIRTIRFQGTVYGVQAFLDLKVRDALRLLQAEVSLGPTHLETLRLQLDLLLPSMPEPVRKRLSLRQIREVAEAARGASHEGNESNPLRLGFWFATAARFYGWGPEVVLGQLSFRQLNRFLDFIPEIQALEQLDNSLTTAYPHMLPHYRKQVFDQWMKRAGLAVPDVKPKTVPWTDVRRFIGASN